MTTELHLIDMAGAERPKSTTSTMLAIIDFEKGEEPSIAGQGMIINYELSQLRTAVVQATEQHHKGLPLVNAKAAGTEFIECAASRTTAARGLTNGKGLATRPTLRTRACRYAKGCFDGSALLSMIVTLSPARSCGWETWFSCTCAPPARRPH